MINPLYILSIICIIIGIHQAIYTGRQWGLTWFFGTLMFFGFLSYFAWYMATCFNLTPTP